MSELTPPRRAYRDYLPEDQREEPGPALAAGEPRPGHGTMFLRFDLFPGQAYASWQDQNRHADLAGDTEEVLAWAFAQLAADLLVMIPGEYRVVGICLPASVADGKAALAAAGAELPDPPVS